MRDRDCVDFLQWALPHLGLRWSGFRKVRRQVCRRITARMTALGLPDVASYRRYLVASPGEWPILGRLCRVTISRFFRDRDMWQVLERRELPRLAAAAELRTEPKLRVWSAGCASGEEPYSLTILWHTALATAHPQTALDIVATDTDLALLARARRAIYPASSVREALVLGKGEAFESLLSDEFRLRSRFRRPLRFAAADIREEAPRGPFDLVLCRNLAFTYYLPALQREVLTKIRSRLAPGGLLAIGSHEELPDNLECAASAGPCLIAIE